MKKRTQTLSRVYQEGKLKDGDIHADLEELVVGKKPGRGSDEERIYFNTVGLSYVDVAIALAMYRRALEHGFREELTLQGTTVFEYPSINEWIRM